MGFFKNVLFNYNIQTLAIDIIKILFFMVDLK